jgi:hypothetical protein
LSVVSPQRYIQAVDEQRLIKRLGLPDTFVGPGDPVCGHAWICFTCGATTISPEPTPCPTPCERCGGIMFETWSDPSPAPMMPKS